MSMADAARRRINHRRDALVPFDRLFEQRDAGRLPPAEPFPEAPDPTSLDRAVRANTAYRRVLFTDRRAPPGSAAQLVAMTVRADRDGSIGWEMHPATAQLFVVVDGVGELLTGRTRDVRAAQRDPITAGSRWLVSPGTWHDVVPAPGSALKLLTIYFPPHHEPATVHRRRIDALR